MSEIQNLKKKLSDFAQDRNWDQFHSPKNLIMALSGEVGELIEIFQWKTIDESKLESLSEKDLKKIKEELSDVFLYLLRMCDKLDVDIISEANKKIEINAQKYPIDLSKDNAIKYNRRNE